MASGASVDSDEGHVGPSVAEVDNCPSLLPLGNARDVFQLPEIGNVSNLPSIPATKC